MIDFEFCRLTAFVPATLYCLNILADFCVWQLHIS